MRALIPLLVSLALLVACQAPATVPAVPPATLASALAAPTPASAVPSQTLAPAVPSPTPTPSAGSRKLAAIGASDVVGLGADNPGTEGWAPVLATLLGERTGQPIALSRHGILGRIARELRKTEVPAAIKVRPDYVVIWTGANDMRVGLSLEAFRPELDGLLQDLDDQTDAQVFVINLPALDRLPFFAAYQASYKAAMPAWQAAIRDAANAHGATAIELAGFSAELDAHPEYLWTDGFHASTKGYARLAAIVADVVAPAIMATKP
jgi:lysophospholipase L1-like esterase